MGGYGDVQLLRDDGLRLDGRKIDEMRPVASLSGQDDLGLASFDAIVAFQRPPDFVGFEWCIGVLADPKTHIRAES